MNDPATRWTLADGRELLLFALPGHTPALVPDRRPLPERGNQKSQLRFDRQTGARPNPALGTEPTSRRADLPCVPDRQG
jgi:hypothetical protein